VATFALVRLGRSVHFVTIRICHTRSLVPTLLSATTHSPTLAPERVFGPAPMILQPPGPTPALDGAPFKMSASPWAIARRPPLVGEHTEEILNQT
jgi:hypothetical protein